MDLIEKFSTKTQKLVECHEGDSLKSNHDDLETKRERGASYNSPSVRNVVHVYMTCKLT